MILRFDHVLQILSATLRSEPQSEGIQHSVFERVKRSFERVKRRYITRGGPPEARALRSAVLLLLITIVGVPLLLWGWIIQISNVELAIGPMLLVLLGAGVLITWRALRLTGASGRQRSRADLPMVSRLWFNIRARPSDLLVAPGLETALSAEVGQGRSEFCTTIAKAGAELGLHGHHISAVHAYDDVEVQAKILCIPSHGEPEEMANKAFMTYFAHWFDDVFDRRVLPSFKEIYSGLPFLEVGGVLPSVKDAIDRAGGAELAQLFEPHAAVWKRGNQSLLEIGFWRVLLGATVCHNDGWSDEARNAHIRLLKRLEKTGGNPGGFDSIVEEFVKADKVNILHLTSKTVQEMWLGIEHPLPNGRLMILYNLLFAPALYYHDCDEELIQGEISTGSWAKITSNTMADAINDCTDKLIGMTDSRKELRALQVRAVAHSFKSVLPEDVFQAYVHSSERLFHASKSPPPPSAPPAQPAR